MKYNTIAVDFDGTIVEDRYPDIGPLIPNARNVLQRYRMAGGKVILWTCRTGQDLINALVFLTQNEIPSMRRTAICRKTWKHFAAAFRTCRIATSKAEKYRQICTSMTETRVGWIG